MKPPRYGPMTSRELVDAVAAAGLDDYNADHTVRLRSFLADLGFDPLDYLRARRDVKCADPDDFATDPRKRHHD